MFRALRPLRVVRAPTLPSRPASRSLLRHHTISAPGRPGSSGASIGAPSASMSSFSNPGSNTSTSTSHSGIGSGSGSTVTVSTPGSGAQGAQMSASSKHPYDPGPGNPTIPRGALKDPAAGPNSRPAEMDSGGAAGGSGTSAAGTSASAGEGSGSGSASAPASGLGASTGASSGASTASATAAAASASVGASALSTSTSSSGMNPAHTNTHTSHSHAGSVSGSGTTAAAGILHRDHDPVRGPSSSPQHASASVPVNEVRDPVRGPSSSPPATPPPVDALPPASEPITNSTIASHPPSVTVDALLSTMNPRSRHPFDTYGFVSRLEKSGVDSASSRALMEGVRSLIVARSEEARGKMLSTEELDNAAYRFKAALSELRTEQSVRTRNDGVAMRSAASAMRREVDGLEQTMKVDLQGLRHDVDLDLNNRKTDTRADMGRFDISVEEINNKFTISLGDLRTEIESTKWDATRRAISIIAMLVIAGVALSTFSIPAKPPPAPAVLLATLPPVMKDASVGPDGPDDHHFEEDHDHDHAHRAHVEQRLDALLDERRRERLEREAARERERERRALAQVRIVDKDGLAAPRYTSERI